MNFKMAAFTQGSLTYAKQLLRILDPFGAYFGTRLIGYPDDSRSENRSLKSLDHLAGMLGVDAEKCLVLDDRVEVWRDKRLASDYVVRVKPFAWFDHDNLRHKVKEIIDLPESIYKQIDRTDRKLVRTTHQKLLLERIGDVVVEIFEQYIRCGKVTEAVSSIRKKVFKGLVLCFDIPGLVDVVHSGSWTEAILYGARCSSAVDSTTTHLIMEGDDTSNVRFRLAKERSDIRIVSARWFIESLNNFEALPEEHYGAAVLSNETSGTRQNNRLLRERVVSLLDENELKRRVPQIRRLSHEELQASHKRKKTNK